MNDRDTEMRSNGDSEIQSHGDTDATEVTDEVPPLAASVGTLQEAVQLSLNAGLDENCLFILARAIRAFEITNNRRLPQAELQMAFSLWWNAAKPLLPHDADFDEWRFDFEQTFAKTKTALGSNSLQEAIRRADAAPAPPQAARYLSSKLKRLVAVCYQLQVLQGRSPFWLSVRDAAKILEEKSLHRASAMMKGLVGDGILTVTEPYTHKRANRFRFNLPTEEETGVTKMKEPPKLANPANISHSRHTPKRNPTKRTSQRSPKSEIEDSENPPRKNKRKQTKPQ